MNILADPVEMTKDYEDAMKVIQPQLKELEIFGDPHLVWARKKALLKEFGVNWRTPKEMNPDVIFG